MIKQALLSIVVITIFLATSCTKDDGEKNKPFIILKGASPMYWSKGISPYVDPGAEAWDITETNDTINISDRLQLTENVNVNTIGEYEAKYNVSDEAGNHADENTRLVRVILTK